jgi:hypothetical protein
MLKKLHNDLFSKREPFAISKDLNSPCLGEFYFVFEEDPSKLNKLIKDFDEKGIPVNTSYIDVEEQKLHYYPISIGQYALAVFNSYVNFKNNEKLNYFIRIAEWFYENRRIDEKLGEFWLTDIPKPEYKVFSPWKSAFTQSRAISVLLRAWQNTDDKKYLESAKRALLPLSFDIRDGGVTVFSKYGKFFEEYVAEEPTMVLDGHIFTLFGIYDFIRAVSKEKDPEYHGLASDLFNEGIDSLIKWLPEFDLGYWIRFNMCKMDHYPEIDPCTIGYLRLIIIQLRALYLITDRKEFLSYSEKFKNYDKPINIFKMYLLKYKALKKINRL